MEDTGSPAAHATIVPLASYRPLEDDPRPICVVTGGAGFIGRHIVRALANDTTTAWRVVVLDRRPYVDVQNGDVVSLVGDITRLADLVAAFKGADCVVHAAGLGGCWRQATPRIALTRTARDAIRRVNVDGTKNVIEAAKQCRVSGLLHISSASVVSRLGRSDGASMQYSTSSEPWAAEWAVRNAVESASLKTEDDGDWHSQTKAQAERMVAAANRRPSTPAASRRQTSGKDALPLATCNLRPALVFGPGDTTFLPALVHAGRSGQSRFVMGTGCAIWDFVFIDNLVEATKSVLQELRQPSSPVCGESYFITNDEPKRCWDMFSIVQARLGYPAPSIYIPTWVCLIIAFVFDVLLFVVKPVFVPQKPLSLSVQHLRLLSSEHTYSCEKAKRDFAYTPRISMDAGLNKTLKTFQHLAVGDSCFQGAKVVLADLAPSPIAVVEDVDEITPALKR